MNGAARSGERGGVVEEIVDENNDTDDEKVTCYPETLPEEIWEVILSKLKDDPEALINCTLAWSRWNEILFAQKPSFMFPLIIPLISKYMSSSDLLRCRQVCKTAKLFTDKYLAYLPLRAPSEMWSRLFESESNSECDYLQLGTITFHNYRNIPEFMRGMKNHGGNPFPARSVVFEEDHRSNAPLPDTRHCDLNGREEAFQEVVRDREESDDLETLLEELLPEFDFEEEHEHAERLHRKWFHRMLRKFGSHIWHLEYVPGSSASLIGHPGYLSETLKNLPNLHSLSLCYDNWFSDTDEDLVQLPELPCLSKLSVVVSVNNDGVHPRLLLQTYGKQLESLECSQDELVHLGSSAYPPFSRLKSLKVSYTWGTTNQALVRTIKSMGIQNLERLYLTLNTAWPVEELEWNLMSVFTLFSATLSQLMLDLDHGSSSCWPHARSPKKPKPTNIDNEIEALHRLHLYFTKLKSVSVESNLLESPVVSTISRVFKMFTVPKILSVFDRKYECHMLEDVLSELTSREDASKLVKSCWQHMPNFEEILWTCVDEERSTEWKWVRADLE